MYYKNVGGNFMIMKFYRCTVCGKIIAMVKDSGVDTICCGKAMEVITPNTMDASKEKHVPVCKVNGNKVEVTIGSAPHPMGDDHYIQWVAIETKYGNQRKALKPSDEPKVCFALCEGDEVENVYAYCNLHGLWKA